LQSGRFDGEIEPAKRTFWRQSVPEIDSSQQISASMIFWTDWFIYKRPTRTGLTPLQTFIQEYRQHLSAEDLAVYRKLLQSIVSVFEVVEVIRNRSITVRDLQDDHMYTVTEKRATRQMAPGYLISAHILPLPDEYRFTAALAPWPPQLKEHVAAFLAGLDTEGNGPQSVEFIPTLEQARRSAYMETINMRRLERAIHLYRGGRACWPEARRLLKKLLEAEPFNPALNFYYGLVCEDMRERERHLLVVQAILPEFQGPWGQRLDFHLSFAFEAQKKYDEAEAAYHRLLRQDPDDSATYYNFGSMLERLGRWEEAEALYRQAAGRFRHDHHCHAVLGHLYLKQDRRDEAREEYQLAWQKARQQLVDFPGCIDDEIMDDLETALREAGGDPATLPEPKPQRRFWR
jgi:tetratricopeptide (TPR) repeat protein